MSKIKKDKQHTPFVVGKEYFVRTVTFYFTGKVSKIIGQFIEFEPGTASLVADTGRFDLFFTNKPEDTCQVLPYGKRKVGINISAITDYAEIK